MSCVGRAAAAPPDSSKLRQETDDELSVTSVGIVVSWGRLGEFVYGSFFHQFLDATRCWLEFVCLSAGAYNVFNGNTCFSLHLESACRGRSGSCNLLIFFTPILLFNLVKM